MDLSQKKGEIQSFKGARNVVRIGLRAKSSDLNQRVSDSKGENEVLVSLARTVIGVGECWGSLASKNSSERGVGNVNSMSLHIGAVWQFML